MSSAGLFGRSWVGLRQPQNAAMTSPARAGCLPANRLGSTTRPMSRRFSLGSRGSRTRPSHQFLAFPSLTPLTSAQADAAHIHGIGRPWRNWLEFRLWWWVEPNSVCNILACNVVPGIATPPGQSLNVFRAANNQPAVLWADVPTELVKHVLFPLMIPACSLFLGVVFSRVRVVERYVSFLAHCRWHVNVTPVRHGETRAGNNSLVELFSDNRNGSVLHNLPDTSGKVVLLPAGHCVDILAEQFIDSTPISPPPAYFDRLQSVMAP